MKRLALAVLAVAAAVVPASPAHAGCHSFSISVSPATVDEGQAVTVTVSRDGNVGPSRVHVRTVAGSAQAPQDYDALVKRPVAFTTETSKSFTLATRNDAAAEGSESFSLHLFDGDGCPPNPAFRYGPDAVVTVRANDEAAPASEAPASEAPTAAPTSYPSPTPDEDAGLSSAQIGLIAVGAVAVLALIGLAFALGRRRSSG